MIEALPAEAFEALVIVAGWLGEVADDDPPYRLDALVTEPVRSWCRLDLVPDAGATTVSLAVWPEADSPQLDIDLVRDAWIAGLNDLDWNDLDGSRRQP